MYLGADDLSNMQNKKQGLSDSKQPLIRDSSSSSSNNPLRGPDRDIVCVDVDIESSPQHAPQRATLANASELGDKTTFIFSHGLTSAEAMRSLEKYGRNELPEKSIPKW